MKVSIITVCYNAAATIEKTIQSVASQTYPDIEYIVVDGASSDNTLSIVRRYKVSKIVSEKDQGIYDAMNKGIRLAAGGILYFLNADDYLYDPQVIQNVVEAYAQDDQLQVLYGKVKYVDIPVKLTRTMKLDDFEYKSDLDLVLKRFICHQGIFAHKRTFEQIGVYDTSYKICADFEWFMRAARRGIKRSYLDRFIAVVSSGGVSYTKRYGGIQEKIRAVFHNASFVHFMAYLAYAGLKKINHIFMEEIVERLRPSRGGRMIR